MNNYFCVKPFYAMEYKQQGATSPCCLLPHNANIEQIKSEMLAKQRPSACQKCWSIEDKGIESDRIIQNIAFDVYANTDIDFVEDECRQGQFSEQIVKLFTSNVCNLTCATCESSSSSAWATLNNKTIINIAVAGVPQLNYTELKILSFVGGEPLLEKKNFKILQHLIDAGNTNCFITFTTNGTIKLSQSHLDILTQFNNLNFCLSIDGINKVYEYMRFPAKWETLLANIKIYQLYNIQLSVSYTISNLNVLYYTETTKWFDEMKLSYNHNIVTFPSYFNPSVLPDNIKANYPELSAFFKTGDYSSEFVLLKIELARQHTLKKIKLVDYMPEISDIFN